MQRAEKIEISKIGNIVNSIFQEPAIAYEDYSAFDSDLKEYDSKELLLKAIDQAVKRGAHSANFAIYYPESKGHFYKDKVTINPDKCNGATYRHSANGWGLVQLQMTFVKSQSQGCVWLQIQPSVLKHGRQLTQSLKIHPSGIAST